jgi:predicted ribosomally synthesized peptide with nif11-like leader
LGKGWEELGGRGGYGGSYGGGWARKCYGILTALERWAKQVMLLRLHAMPEEQLSALLAKLKDDEGLQVKLKGAADLNAAVAMAKEAGFDVSKADLLKYQAKQTLELSDEELEGAGGGRELNRSNKGQIETQCCICGGTK